MTGWLTSPGRARLGAIAAAIALLGACTPAEPRGEAAPSVTPVEAPAAMPTLPDLPAIAVAPPEEDRAPEPTPQPVGPPAFALEPVETLTPELVLSAPDGSSLDGDAVAAALEAPGVTFATLVTVGTADVELPDGRRGQLGVAAVDPAGYRVLVPQATADAPDLWERVVEGGLTVAFELAEELGLGLDDWLGVDGEGQVRVTGIAALGQPPVASAVIGAEHARLLGLGPPNRLLVAVDPEAWPDEVGDGLAEALGLEVTLIYGKPQRVLPELPRDTVWDELALCESSGNWAANTGNGYYGGLQFLPSSWHLVGGVGLPHEASRDEQIHRAELLLARQGWRAWPVCSVRLGLRQPGPGEGPDGRPLRPSSRPAPAPAPGPSPGDGASGDSATPAPEG
jgi:hypothetical protein